MFYFFQRGTEFIRCTIDGARGVGYTITITEPDGQERTESLPTSDAAHARWIELQQRFSRMAGGDRTAVSDAVGYSVGLLPPRRRAAAATRDKSQ